MPKVNVVLLKQNQKKDGTFSIYVRIFGSGIRKLINTGYSVLPHQFKEGQSNWVVRHPDSVLINTAIEAKRSEAMNIVVVADISGTDMAIALGAKTKKITIGELLLERAKKHEALSSIRFFKKILSVRTMIIDCWGVDKAIQNITKQDAENYELYRRKAGINPNTIRNEIKLLAHAINSAIEDEIFVGANVFKMLKIKAVPARKDKLTVEELQAMIDVELEGDMAIARDMFLFSFYTHGMRFQNVLLFEKEMINGDSINYQMNKGRKHREIRVHGKLKEIINRYIHEPGPYLFPLLKNRIISKEQLHYDKDVANTTVNKQLKKVCVLAGVKKLITFHLARHTFAYLALQKGVGYDILKDALGHTDFATTQMYLKALSDDRINDA